MALVLVLGFMACQQESQPTLPQFEAVDNPLFHEFNQAIDFAAVNAAHIDEAKTLIQERTQQRIDHIVGFEGERTFENTLVALDETYDRMSGIYSTLYLVQSTHPDSTIRSHAQAAVTELGKFSNELQLDEGLYQTLKTFEGSAAAKELTAVRARNLERLVASFERNGFALDSAGRAQLKTVQDRVTELGNSFNQNIAAYKDHFIATEAQVQGLPADWKATRKKKMVLIR